MTPPFKNQFVGIVAPLVIFLAFHRIINPQFQIIPHQTNIESHSIDKKTVTVTGELCFSTKT